MNNVTGSPISTIIGLALAGLVALQQYIAAGSKLTWQTAVLVFAIAAIGALKNDSSFNLGLLDNLVLKHVKGQLEDKLKEETVTKAIILITLLALSFAPMQAQTVTPETTAMPTNIYAAGISYNRGGTPAVAGTGLYARLLASSNTYAFTIVDAMPVNGVKNAVDTAMGVGVAQKVFDLPVAGRNIPILVNTSAGIAWSGTNTGWKYDFGASAYIKLKNGPYFLMPMARADKINVPGGAAIQPIIGVVFGFGK